MGCRNDLHDRMTGTLAESWYRNKCHTRRCRGPKGLTIREARWIRQLQEALNLKLVSNVQGVVVDLHVVSTMSPPMTSVSITVSISV
jgi:hypothetical protein